MITASRLRELDVSDRPAPVPLGELGPPRLRWVTGLARRLIFCIFERSLCRARYHARSQGLSGILADGSRTSGAKCGELARR